MPVNRRTSFVLIAASILIAPSAVGQTRPTEPRDYSPPAGAPYRAESVTVTTPMGHTLAGTLTISSEATKDHPVAAIVTISGTGPQDRDENLGFGGYRPFRQFADSLGRRGIAVLRMDDRGVGGSKGTFRGATPVDFVQDIRAGLAFLRTRPEIDPKRLGLLGHSEGAIDAPMVDTTLTPATREARLAHVPAQIDSLSAADPYMGFMASYDPTPTARKVSKPAILIVTGANDRQADPTQLSDWVAAFKEAGNRDVTGQVLPGLNHLFVPDPDGYPGGYAKLPQPLMVTAPVVGMVVDWLSQRLK